MRSGTFFAVNDYLIEALIKDVRYQIKEDGTIYRLSGNVWKQTGRAITDKSGMKYRHLKYQNHNLLVHRIVYARFVGRLSSDLVINHIDGNSLNNKPSNLELITQSKNIIHAKNENSR
jgi:hypothetical protein